MKLELRDLSGAVIDSIEVLDDVFGAPANDPLVHQVMVGQLANRRQGTAKVKTRAEVSGGGAKPRPQKGSGRARQGSIRSPQWKGGGVVFGPAPRSYRQRTPRQMRRESIKIVLSGKVRDRQLLVIENLNLDQPKTKEMAKVLKALSVDSSALVVADGASAEVIRAARNIPRIRTLPAALLNTTELLNARKIIMTLEAVQKAESLWGGAFVRKKASAGVQVMEEPEPEQEAEATTEDAEDSGEN